MNKALMRAVAEAALFAGLSPDDVVQPDAAVAQLEQLAAALKALSAGERETFRHFLDDLANDEAKSGTSERAEFLRSVFENLGLGEGVTPA